MHIAFIKMQQQVSDISSVQTPDISSCIVPRLDPEFNANTPRAGLPVAKDDSSNTAILIGCLVGIILLLLAVIAVILWRQYWKKILGKVSQKLMSRVTTEFHLKAAIRMCRRASGLIE